MNLQKAITILAAVLGLVGVVLLFLVIGAGDEEIKMASMQGDYGVVSPFITLAIIIVAITVLITVVFSIKNLTANPAKLKNALIMTGAFLAIVLLSFLLSSGEETPLKDGEVLSASGARWVETGLRTFYFLAIIAAGSMAFTGVKKLIKR